MPTPNPKNPEAAKTADVLAGRLPQEPGEGETVLEGEDTRDHDREVFRRLAGTTEDDGEEGGGRQTDDVELLELLGEGDSPREPAGRKAGDTGKSAERLELELVATRVLKRDLGDEDAVKTLLKLPDDKLRALVEKRRKTQTAGDQMGNRLAAIERQLAAKAKTGEGGTAQEPEGGDGGDPEDLLTDLVDRAATGDTTAAQLLKKYRKQLLTGRPAPNGQAPAHDAGETDPDVRNAVILSKLRAPLDQAAKTYPSLRKDVGRLRLVSRLDTLFKAGAFDADTPLEEMVLAAARVEFQGEAKAAREQTRRRAAEEVDGQPEGGGKAATAPAGLTEEQSDRLAFRLLDRGISPAKVSAHLQSRRTA